MTTTHDIDGAVERLTAWADALARPINYGSFIGDEDGCTAAEDEAADKARKAADLRACVSSLALMKAQKEALREALEPFSVAAFHYRADRADTPLTLPRSYAAGPDDWTPIVRVTDFRRARAALSTEGGKGLGADVATASATPVAQERHPEQGARVALGALLDMAEEVAGYDDRNGDLGLAQALMNCRYDLRVLASTTEPTPDAARGSEGQERTK